MLRMGPLLRFVGLSIKSKPVAACVAVLLMAAGLNFQEIASGFVTDPRLIAWASRWWMPWVFAFCAFWVLAYVFWRQSEVQRANRLRADMDLRVAVDYLRVKSRWAVGRAYNANPNHLLEEDIDGIIRDAAIQGRVTIWGRPAEV
jgi:hypothetical protein